MRGRGLCVWGAAGAKGLCVSWPEDRFVAEGPAALLRCEGGGVELSRFLGEL